MIYFMSNPVPSFNDLVDQPFDLKSPFRSTVPLLAFWTDFNARLTEFCRAIGFPIPLSPSLAFEYRVAPIMGQGEASHTDLMIWKGSAAIATEAKYTEGKDDSVSKWLGDPPATNKTLVLEGWVKLINDAVGCGLTVDLVQNIGYQLIHRTASACQAGAERRAIVYHYFDPINSMISYRSEQLSSLAGLVAAPERLPFFLYMTTLSKTPEYAQLQADWLSRTPRPDMSEHVRKLLKERRVATFIEPVILMF